MRWRCLGVLLGLGACAPAVPPAAVFYASGAELQSIDPLVTVHPLAKQVQRFALFMPLVRYDSALRVEPYLAERWRFTRGGRGLEFTLRPDVRWHDGVPVTSADVVFTLDAARDPATGYPRAADLACLTEVRARDAATVQLTFCRPQPGVADVFADLPIVPAHCFAGVPHAALRRAPFNAQPVGDGPYRFVAHVPQQRWVFEANPAFPPALGGPPEIHWLVIVIVDETTTKLAGLVTGDLDVAGIGPMHAGLVRRDRLLRLLDYPILFTYGLVWNTRRPLFADPRLRRALTLAIDRRQIVNAYLYGFGVVADGPVPPWHPLAVAVPAVPFDRAWSRALLDSLGWAAGADGVRRRGGARLAFTILTVGSADNMMEQLIQADLRAVGADVAIRQLELGAFLATAQAPARDYDALVTGIPGDLSLGYLDGLFDSRRLDEPLQYAQYRSLAADRALAARDYGAVQRLVARDLPITFLYHARGVQGMSRRLHGVRMDLRGELATLARWRLLPAREEAAR